jgi:hypothetical protein
MEQRKKAKKKAQQLKQQQQQQQEQQRPFLTPPRVTLSKPTASSRQLLLHPQQQQQQQFLSFTSPVPIPSHALNSLPSPSSTDEQQQATEHKTRQVFSSLSVADQETAEAAMMMTTTTTTTTSAEDLRYRYNRGGGRTSPLGRKIRSILSMGSTFLLSCFSFSFSSLVLSFFLFFLAVFISSSHSRLFFSSFSARSPLCSGSFFVGET